MRPVKLSKTLLKKDLEHILSELGAVSTKYGIAYPEHVYLSKEDMKTIKKNLHKIFKKEHPYMSEKITKTMAMYDFLNLGPNSTLENVIKPGYALVDSKSILQEEYRHIFFNILRKVI